MVNNAKHNYGQGNRNFQDDTNNDADIKSEGSRDANKKDGPVSDNESSNDAEDKRPLTQEGYADDTDFGQKPVERYPTPKDSTVDDDSHHEEDEDEDKEDHEDKKNEEEDFEEETNLDDEINPDKNKDFYLREDGTNYNSVFDL